MYNMRKRRKLMLVIFAIATLNLKFYNYELAEENKKLTTLTRHPLLLDNLTTRYHVYSWIVWYNVGLNKHIEGTEMLRYLSYDFMRRVFFENRDDFEAAVKYTVQLSNNPAIKASEKPELEKKIELHRKNLEDKILFLLKEPYEFLFKYDQEAKKNLHISDNDSWKNDDSYAVYFFLPGKMLFIFSPRDDLYNTRSGGIQFGGKFVLAPQWIMEPIDIFLRHMETEEPSWWKPTVEKYIKILKS